MFLKECKYIFKEKNIKYYVDNIEVSFDSDSENSEKENSDEENSDEASQKIFFYDLFFYI